MSDVINKEEIRRLVESHKESLTIFEHDRALIASGVFAVDAGQFSLAGGSSKVTANKIKEALLNSADNVITATQARIDVLSELLLA